MFNLIPFEGTDSIKLGMTSNEITNILNKKPKQIEDGEDYGFVTVDYDEEGKSIAFEFKDLDDSCQVYFNNIPLLGQPYSKIRGLFQTWDENLRYDSGFISFKYMIAACFDEELVTGVLIANQNYYDEFDYDDLSF